MNTFENQWPTEGWGEQRTKAFFADAIKAKSAMLDSDVFFAHMDPPTPDIASELVGLNARYNQNLLHPDLSPFASAAETRLIEWLAPRYGMTDGHLCSGSTLGNLTALWAAREAGAKRVVASRDAHLSVPKSAHLLGLPYQAISTTTDGRMDMSSVGELDDAVLVLSAGTTGRGAIDPLDTGHKACWTHVDAAWAGPLMLTRHKNLLQGITDADSIAISAHKWFYQPKDSAIILFKSRDTRDSISFGAAYLTTPNVGIQGSRSAAAIPLMATLLAWGQSGLASRIERDMRNANLLADFIEAEPSMTLKQRPTTGVLNWRPAHGDIERAITELKDVASTTVINGETWLRQVAANPHADIDKVGERLKAAADN